LADGDWRWRDSSNSPRR